jgi:hypothetical protein
VSPEPHTKKNVGIFQAQFILDDNNNFPRHEQNFMTEEPSQNSKQLFEESDKKDVS